MLLSSFQVYLVSKVPTLNSRPGDILQEFPAELYYTSVTRDLHSVEVSSVFGLTVNCNLEPFVCNVTVPGYYHNKTLGTYIYI